MEVNKFQILLIIVTFSFLTGLKADMQCANKKCKKRIWTAPAVKGLKQAMCCIDVTIELKGLLLPWH